MDLTTDTIYARGDYDRVQDDYTALEFVLTVGHSWERRNMNGDWLPYVLERIEERWIDEEDWLSDPTQRAAHVFFWREYGTGAILRLDRHAMWELLSANAFRRMDPLVLLSGALDAAPDGPMAEALRKLRGYLPER